MAIHLTVLCEKFEPKKHSIRYFASKPEDPADVAPFDSIYIFRAKLEGRIPPKLLITIEEVK
jgi:hypothetical protein